VRNYGGLGRHIGPPPPSLGIWLFLTRESLDKGILPGNVLDLCKLLHQHLFLVDRILILVTRFNLLGKLLSLPGHDPIQNGQDMLPSAIAVNLGKNIFFLIEVGALFSQCLQPSLQGRSCRCVINARHLYMTLVQKWRP
jgi:hypothetical protein